jgi:hypothetical protein
MVEHQRKPVRGPADLQVKPSAIGQQNMIENVHATILAARSAAGTGGPSHR